VTSERSVFTGAMAITGISLAVVAAVTGAIAWRLDGDRAALAVAAGVAVAAFVGISTQAALLVGSRRSSSTLAAIVFGAFLAKIVVVVGVLWAVSATDALPRRWFGLPLIAAAVVTLVIDLVVVARSRVPYVSPERGGTGR